MLSRKAGCRVFSYGEIEKATNYFDDSNVIGSGGEGKVYKGTISDGQKTVPVAVKYLKFKSNEFEKEIDMISNLHHANLVSLIGYCKQQDTKILVYELMANGSLHDHIYRLGGCSLSLEDRMKICIGAARGLEYLHNGTSNVSKIIHRDVKPANILLDESFDPKISDFGLSRRGPANQTRSAISTALRGTAGYYAPEYLQTSRITVKVDVYAFGLVLFEILCGKKSWERLGDDSNVRDPSISEWAYGNIDKILQGEISTNCLNVFIDIAEKCVNKDPFHRPTMSEVVSKLEDAIKLQFTSKSGNTSSSSRKPKVEIQAYKYLPMIPESRIQKDIASNVKTASLENTPRIRTNSGSSITHSIRRTLPDIADIERKIVLYSSFQTLTDCHKIRLYLNVYKVVIEERDPTRDERYEAELRRFFSQTGRRYSLPQLFIGGKYVGGADEVDRLYCSGELRDLLSKLNQV